MEAKMTPTPRFKGGPTPRFKGLNRDIGINRDIGKREAILKDSYMQLSLQRSFFDFVDFGRS